MKKQVHQTRAQFGLGRKNRFALSGLLFSMLIIMAAWLTNLAGAQPALAQAGGDSWTTPVNLSNSGSATSPQIVIGSDQRTHVFWVDEFNGWMYSGGDGAQWSAPQPVVLPFASDRETILPVLVAGADGWVHAVWLNSDGTLITSRVLSENIGQAAWAATFVLAESAVAFDVQVDALGQLHLLYAQAEDLAVQTAGIYYRRSDPGAGAWTQAQGLAASPYYRSLTRENASLHLAVGGAGDDAVVPGAATIFSAWDNPARERIFLARSEDGGETWGEPVEVESPLEGSLSSGPFNLLVHAFDRQVLLIWQAARSGVNCSQFYQWSQDGGETWQPRQRMLESILGCPQNNRILMGSAEDGGAGDGGAGQQVYLMTDINNQVYLQAWGGGEGGEWSAPQLQNPLASFTDPATFRPVTFGCRQAALRGARDLFVVGCDSGSNGDVWITSRQLSDPSAWFVQGSLWSRLTSVVAGQVPAIGQQMVSDASERFHLFWVERDTAASGAAGKAIRYTRLEKGQWSAPQPVLASPEGVTAEPSVVLGGENLYVVWSSAGSGPLYFSRVNAGRAVLPAAWSEPQALPAPVPAGVNPEIQVGPAGELVVIYAIPWNEQRGIYLTTSTDGGQTWSEAEQVFDAAGAGWALVGDPHLAITSTGQRHAAWVRFASPGAAGSLGLYAATSPEPAGATEPAGAWSAPLAVTEQPVMWSRMLVSSSGAVHRVWQESSGGRLALWHESSQDGGATWARIAPASIFGETSGAPGLAQDAAGRLHLIQAVSRSAPNQSVQTYTLQHWVYDRGNWTTEQNLDLRDAVSSDLASLVAQVSPQGNLAIVFAGQTLDGTTGLLESHLFFANRRLNMPDGVEQAPVNAPPSATQPVEPQPAGPASEATSVAVSVDLGDLANQPAAPSSSTGNPWSGAVVGFAVAGLMVAVIFILAARGALLGRR